MADGSAALLVLVPLLWFITAMMLLQARHRRKAGRQLWALYGKVGSGLGLEVREEVSAGYGLPDLVGDVHGRRVLVHPIVGRGSAGVPKTVYAASHTVALRKRTLVSPADVSPFTVGRYRHSVHVLGVRGRYLVTAQSRDDRPNVRRLLSSDALRVLDDLASENRSGFLSLVLQSGTVLFYTEGWEENYDALERNLRLVVALAEAIDQSVQESVPPVSPLFSRLEKRRHPRTVDTAAAGLLASLGAVLAVGTPFLVPDLVSVFLLENVCAILVLVGASRIYAAATMRSRAPVPSGASGR